VDLPRFGSETQVVTLQLENGDEKEEEEDYEDQRQRKGNLIFSSLSALFVSSFPSTGQERDE